MGHHERKLKLKNDLAEVKTDWRNDLVKLYEYQSASNDQDARMALQKMIETLKEWVKAK